MFQFLNLLVQKIKNTDIEKDIPFSFCPSCWAINCILKIHFLCTMLCSEHTTCICLGQFQYYNKYQRLCGLYTIDFFSPSQVWSQHGRGLVRAFFQVVDCWLLIYLFIYLLTYLLIFRERGREGERRKGRRDESICGCLSSAPYWGPGPQPRHVPWLGI